MKLTRALNVRSWIAKLHPPLPATREESHQLLSVLQSSFKRQLDESHPPVNVKEALKSNVNDSAVSGPYSASAKAADDHLSSILRHPLLTHSGSGEWRHKSVAMFDAALVSGEVSMSLLQSSVEDYRRYKEQCCSLTNISKLGTRISLWFNAADANTREMFLTSASMSEVIHVMYMDEMEETVWQWLGMLYSGNFGAVNTKSSYDPSSKSWLNVEARFVHYMLWERLRMKNVAAAVDEFLHARTYSLNSGRTPRKILESMRAIDCQVAARSCLMLSIAILRRRHQHGISAELYDKFIRHAPFWADDLHIGPEFLQLYHPTTPNANDLYQLLQSPDFSDVVVTKMRERGDGLQKTVAMSLLSGAQLLLEQNQTAKTQFILDWTQQHFPDVVPQYEAADRRTRLHLAITQLEKTLTWIRPRGSPMPLLG